MAFKVGQKVVRIIEGNSNDPLSPKLGEICTSNGISHQDIEYFYIREYPTDDKGNRQSFKMKNFRPLDELLAEQSDFDLWKIEQEIEKEALQPA